MQRHNALPILLIAFLTLASGCNRTNSKAQFRAAINSYYEAHPVCLWQQPRKFPVQAETSDQAKTGRYDALTDAGLLSRTTAEKKTFLIGSKQVNDYDISSRGRSLWTQDPTQPGYGNFCYAHREVTSIDNASTSVNSTGQKTAVVNYHFAMSDVAGWAQSQEMKTAFPQLSNIGSGTQPAQTTLTWNGNGWQVSQQ
jgi:hypothetical protein